MHETSTAYTEAPLSSFLHRLRRYTVKLCHRLHRPGIGHAYTVSSRLRLHRHRIVRRFVTAVIAAGLVLCVVGTTTREPCRRHWSAILHERMVATCAHNGRPTPSPFRAWFRL